MKHPNVIKLFHIIETIENIYLVLKYASGRHLLHCFLEARGMWEEEAQRVLMQIMCTLYYHQAQRSEAGEHLGGCQRKYQTH